MAHKDLAGHWIHGRWQESRGEGTIDVVDPARETVLATAPAGSEADSRAAIAAARAALAGWADAPIETRIGAVERLVGVLQDRAEEMAETLVAEVGVPLRVARGTQVGLAAALAGTFLPVAGAYAFEEEVGHSRVTREPVGVVGAITPWNVPLLLSLQKIVPALLAGCTVVHKPSELTPLHAGLLAEITAECGFPPGVYNVVFGEGPVVGAELARNPDVDLVSLTGSTRAGREVASLAASTLKHVHLELGGKNASVVLPDADIEKAVRATVDQCCFNTGQACLQWSRLLVPASRQDEAVEIAAESMRDYRVGDPWADDTDMGPLISAAARERVRGYIGRGIGQGARLMLGGPERPDGLDVGYYVRPTLFADVDSSMAIAQEEIFGPVLSVLSYTDEDDAIRIANDTPYGLHGSVWSSDDERAVAFARRMRTGLVDVNGGPFNPFAPFGGVKQSGLGRECGRLGFEAFLETKSLQLPVPDGGAVGPRLRDTDGS